ncbi:NmrA family NAD(P)-binding protein [Actinopolymorpha sp. B17G11]|uniref:NmrA family NAD(P)-binding protein n=1 Tax=Actinopolymorpha sp. B17G11 TaxID=3160861 RepID=UPI0032E4CEED
MANAPVLVAGAAGGVQGSTGNLVARGLLEKGIPVRAFVRTDDDRAAGLRTQGAEVYVGDLREIADVGPALRGVERAFFTYPVRDGLLEASAVFASAAAREGVRQVVEVSQLAPEPHAGTPRLRQHWVSEQVFDHAGVGAVHLRATVFYENIRALITTGPNGHQLVMPLGGQDAVLPLVGGRDVASVAVGVLAAPEVRPAGFHRLVAGFASVSDVMATFEVATGRPLRYVDVPSQAWKQSMLDNGLNAHAAAHLTSLWEVFRAAGAANWADPAYERNDAIARIGGQRAQTLEEFLRSNANHFASVGTP